MLHSDFTPSHSECEYSTSYSIYLTFQLLITSQINYIILDQATEEYIEVFKIINISLIQ